MNKACVFFKISDLAMHYPRNYKKYPDITQVKDYNYNEKYGRYTKADLFFKPGINKYPVIINVHGGGFVKGDKRHRRAISCEFAREGWFVFNINYRLSPEYPMPSASVDVVDAIAHLPHLAELYPLDLTKVVVTGDSAGGFYSASAVVACFNKDFADILGVTQPTIKPQAFIGFCGAYRLGDILSKKTPFNVAFDIASALMGEKKIDNVEDIKNHKKFVLTDLVSQVNEQFPKTLLIYSKHDAFCGGQGEILSDSLKALGVPVTEGIYSGNKDIHCFHLLPYHKSTPDCMEKVRNFLKDIYNN